MATTTELRLSPSAHWELVFLIDGIARGFVSDADLETLDSGDGREYVRGLVRDGLVRRMAIDPRSGRIIPQQHEIRLRDDAGDLAELFATAHDSMEPLERNIEPGDDLSALSEFHDRWIGHEKIGPAGERHEYPVPLGFDIGLQHYTLHEDAEDSENPMRPPMVSDAPITWKGRRCMLYRVYRDHIGSATLDASLRFRPDLESLVDGPSGIAGEEVGGTHYRGGPRKARDFDGVNGKARWGGAANSMPNLVGSAFTVSFWIYQRAAAEDHAFYTYLDNTSGAFFIDIMANGSVRALWATSGVSMVRQSAASVIAANTWVNVTVRGDGSLTAANYTIDIDGTEVASYATTTNGTGVARATAFRWVLGGRNLNTTNDLDGRMSKPSVWLRQLSDDEVVEYYHTAYGFRPPDEWERIWWGTMEDAGEVVGREWRLRCAGVESWLQKDLGTLYQQQETPIDLPIRYVKRSENAEAHEGGIAILIYTSNEGANGGAGGGLSGAYADVQFDDSWEFTEDGIFELRNELVAAFTNAFGASGADGAWSALAGCFLGMSGADKTITFSMGEEVAERAFVEICMHQRLWGHLGFDVGQPVEPSEIDPSGGFGWWRSEGIRDEAPGDGYVFYRIVLKGEEDDRPAVTGTLEPQYTGGVISLDPDAIKSEAGQEMLVDTYQGSTKAHFGQLLTPPASDPNDPDAPYQIGPGVDRSGFWLLSGPRRFADESEEVPTYQVVEGSWRNLEGCVTAGRVVLTGLLDPRKFGFSTKRITTPWNAQPGQIVARPLVVLGYEQGSGLDAAHIVMQRLLLTTGTSTGWDSYSLDSPVLDAGDNESSHDGNVRRDAEYADLGCGIPSEMVQHASRWRNEAEAVGDDAIRCKVAITPGQNSEDVFHGLMEPIGWSWSLRDGKYGVFCPFHSIEEEQVEVAITRARVDKKTSAKMVIPGQELRIHAPIDRFEISASWSPFLEEYLFTTTRKSLDRSVRYRAAVQPEKIAAPWWRGIKGQEAVQPIADRLQLKAAFWERRHYVVKRLPVLPTIGRQLWPGTFVRYTHPVSVDPIEGTYGVEGRRGVVLSLAEDLSRDRSAGFNVDLLIHADRSAVAKLHAFSCRGYGYDSDNDRILVHDNWLGLAGDGTRVDSAFVVEPAYVGVEPFGGDARVKWYQWDGSGWEVTGTGVVTAVGTTPGSCYLELATGIATGTYYPCKETIVVPVAISEQDAAWVLQLYAPIGDEDGEYEPGTRTSLWEDVA